jgi:hypothetical protein
MSLIVVDTQILIWAVKREATPGQEPMIEKSRALSGASGQMQRLDHHSQRGVQ